MTDNDNLFDFVSIKTDGLGIFVATEGNGAELARTEIPDYDQLVDRTPENDRVHEEALVRLVKDAWAELGRRYN